MTSNTRWAAAFAVVAGMVMASSANATWTFSSTGTVNSPTERNANGGVGITTVAGYASSGAVGSTWASNGLLFYSNGGLAMDSDGSNVPNHAIDNKGNTEAVLLGFSSSIVLSSISLGYATDGSNCTTKNNITTCNQTPVDASVFRYTGPTSSTAPSFGTIGPSMSNSGWELVGNYGDLINGGATTPNAVNGGAKASSWWLISAYNSNFGTAGETRLGGVNAPPLDNGNDYFKILAVNGTKCTSPAVGVCSGGGGGSNSSSVPEPASLALASVSLMGLFGIRRRNNNKQA